MDLESNQFGGKFHENRSIFILWRISSQALSISSTKTPLSFELITLWQSPSFLLFGKSPVKNNDLTFYEYRPVDITLSFENG